MANPDHFSKLKEGTVHWNVWRRDKSEVIPDLREAKLRRADLRRILGVRLEVRINGTTMPCPIIQPPFGRSPRNGRPRVSAVLTPIPSADALHLHVARRRMRRKGFRSSSSR